MGKYRKYVKCCPEYQGPRIVGHVFVGRYFERFSSSITFDKVFDGLYHSAMEIAIDTLKIFERLRAANLNEQAAKEIAEVIREVSLESEKGLATKGDLRQLKTEIDGELKLINGCWAFLLLESYL